MFFPKNIKKPSIYRQFPISMCDYRVASNGSLMKMGNSIPSSPTQRVSIATSGALPKSVSALKNAAICIPCTPDKSYSKSGCV